MKTPVSMMVATHQILTIPEQERPSRRAIIREFASTTSTHGLPNIARSQSIHNFLFWSLACFAFITIMVYFIVKAILNYFDYPTNMDIAYVQQWPQYFPAVSICNGSPLRLDQFIGPFLNYTNALNLTFGNSTTTVSPDQIPYMYNYLIELTNKNQLTQSVFFSLTSMLYSCTYNSIPCSTTDFISFISSAYGLCYTFNPKLKNGTNDQIRYVSQYGGSGVLELGLYAHTEQYVPYFKNGK